VKAGQTCGETDGSSYDIVRDPVHTHDLNATILRLMGIDHPKLTDLYQGRDFRLTDIHGELVAPLLAWRRRGRRGYGRVIALDNSRSRLCIEAHEHELSNRRGEAERVHGENAGRHGGGDECRACAARR
jgi:hypothetical protein